MKVKLNTAARNYCPQTIIEADNNNQLYLVELQTNGKAYIGTSPTDVSGVCTFVNTRDITMYD